MTVEIGDILKNYLSTLTFIDKLAGVVKPITKTDLDKDNRSVRKTFPVSCGMSYEECVNNSKYLDLVPNSKLKCMVYLEDNGIRPEGMNGANKIFRASYKLVCWMNLKKLGKANDCSISGKVLGTIMATIPEHPANSGIYQKIQVEFGGQDSKSVNPFSRYSYDEDKTQYLMHPYDYFSMPIDVRFEVNNSCIEPFEPEEESVCN